MQIDLHPKQSRAFQEPANEKLYGGSAGGGKSFLLRSVGLSLCSQIRRLQCYLFRRQSQDIIRNHFEGPGSFPDLLGPWMDRNFCRIVYSPNTIIRFANKANVHVCHCQLEKHKYNYQGPEIHVLLIDELTHFTESIYRYLRARCRMPKNDPEMWEDIRKLEEKLGFKLNFPLVFCGANPGGVGHNWVKASWIDPLKPFEIKKMPKDEGGMLRQFIPAKLKDNPSLDPEEYADKLAGLGNPALVKAMLDGSWDIVAGGMFDDLWNPEVHIVDPFPIPKSWRVDRSFDWGSSKPFSVGWWAESDGTDLKLKSGKIIPTVRGDLFRIAELYGWNGKPNEGCKLLAVEVARKIKKIEDRFPFKVNPGPADSSIWKEEDGPSISGNMQSAGIKWTKANKKPGSRAIGWELMRERLKGSVTREDPGLFIFNTCRHFIRTIPVLPRDETKSDDINTDAEDHIADETRYRILTKIKRIKGGSVRGLGG